MFGGGYGYRGGSRTPRRNPSAIDASKIRKWRVIAEKPIPVAEDDEGEVLVYDLEPRTLCDVAEQKHMPNGEIRAMIVDPVWKGWITLKTRGGDSLCEPVDDDSGTSNGALTGDGGAAAATGPLVVQLTLAQLKDLQLECVADDVDIEPDEMVYWSEEEARLCFESGGAERPPRRNTAAPAGGAAAVDLSADTAEGQGGGGGDGSGSGDGAAQVEEASATAGADVPMSEKQKAARDAGEWKKGVMVLLRGLSSETSLNGRSGVISSWDAERGRYDVRLANRVVRALPSHLGYHPLQKQRDANDRERGDEVVFMTEDAKAARAGPEQAGPAVLVRRGAEAGLRRRQRVRGARAAGRVHGGLYEDSEAVS